MVYKTRAKQTSEVIISELTILYLIGTAVVLEEKIHRTTHVTTDSGQTVGLDVMADSASGISFLPHSSFSQQFVNYDFAKTLIGAQEYAQEPLHFNGILLCLHYRPQD